jgi:hypothetical protein
MRPCRIDGKTDDHGTFKREAGMKRDTVSAGWQSAGVPVSNGMSYRRVEQDGITIACYQNQIPPFIEAEMERLYQNIFSSMAQFRVYGALAGAVNTYVVWKDRRIVTIFLFSREKGRVQVLNEVIQVSRQDVDRFANYLFSAFGTISAISFRAVRTDGAKLRFPSQCYNYSEDIVLELSPSVEQYYNRLGKNTRRNIKRYSERLTRTFPSFSFSVSEKEKIERDDVREIIRMNRARMAGKHKVSAIDDEETDRIISLVRECGMVGIARIDGTICAGTICYRIGNNFFLSVLAHDPVYDHYWLGILSCYQTICACIARSGRDFHFLWGKYEYKYTLLAEPRQLDHLIVYRSLGHMALNLDLALQAAAKGWRRRLTLRLHDAAHGQGALARWLLRALNQVRIMRGA